MKAFFVMLAFAVGAAFFCVWLLRTMPKVPPIQIPQTTAQEQPVKIPKETSVAAPVAPVTWGDIQNQIRRKADAAAAAAAPEPPEAPVPPEPDPYAGIDTLNAKAQKELQERFAALQAARSSTTNAETNEVQRPKGSGSGN